MVSSGLVSGWLQRRNTVLPDRAAAEIGKPLHSRGSGGKCPFSSRRYSLPSRLSFPPLCTGRYSEYLDPGYTQQDLDTNPVKKGTGEPNLNLWEKVAPPLVEMPVPSAWPGWGPHAGRQPYSPAQLPVRLLCALMLLLYF